MLTTAHSQLLINLGTALFVLGLTHLIPGIALLDAQVFHYAHTRTRVLGPVFRLLWHFGRTPFSLLVIALIIFVKPEMGLTLAIVFILIISLEWFIKRSLQRVRPFKLIPDTVMGQPREPLDPSFPSGDALRIWFLALSLPIGLGAALPVILGAAVVAMLITLGRIGLGVHYPLDILGGSGLGILAAGLWLRTLATFL
ncbi:MAG: phosphatase PAP2 family protein [Chloroflexi bacterium]|nr:phosphatase PAP2 family protein [Chloroflexota bacterium]